jgi:hypothetical protein
MRRKYVLSILFAVAISVSCLSLSAQRATRTIRDKGPLFISGLSFYQGVARVPYNVLPGEEDATHNMKRVAIPVFSVSQFAGYQFSPYIALGVGINFDYWTLKNAFLPVYADVRFNMTDRKIAPHAYVNLGYAIRWHLDSKPYKASTNNSADYIMHGYTSGVMGEIGLGMKANVGYKTAIVITAFGKVQESALRYYEGASPGQNMKPLLLNKDANSLYIFAGIKVGFMF